MKAVFTMNDMGGVTITIEAETCVEAVALRFLDKYQSPAISLDWGSYERKRALEP